MYEILKNANSFFFFFFFFIFLFFQKFYLKKNHMHPILNPPPAQPPHTIPLGLPSAPAPSINALDLDYGPD